MKTTPDISAITAFIEQPACAAMMSALIGGRALTARELARGTGTPLETARGHLAALEQAGAARFDAVFRV